MLDLLYHKHNFLITTVVDGSIFKNVERRYYFYPGITVKKLYLTLKHIFIQIKSFFNYLALKMILLYILQNFAIYYFISHIMIISQNDTFLYKIGQIKFPCAA